MRREDRAEMIRGMMVRWGLDENETVECEEYIYEMLEVRL